MAVAQAFLDAHYERDGRHGLLHHRGAFHGWQGTHWREAEDRALRAQLYRWLENAQYEKRTKNDLELVPFEPTRPKIVNVLEALAAVVHHPEQLEPPIWLGPGSGRPQRLVAFENGLLDLESRQLHPHSSSFFNLYALPFAYDPDAEAPRWLAFLRELWGDDDESIELLAEIFGYIIAGLTEQQKLFLLSGPKRAGKGTILRVLIALLGRDNVAAPTLSALSTQFGLQALIGKPLAAISDARLSGRGDSLVAVERLLSISGEDTITVDRKYRAPWTGRLPARFVVLTNEIPRFTDASGALASRFVILSLTESFIGREDPQLTERLLEESSGIFNWALVGFDRLTSRGHFRQPKAAASALRQLEDLASPVSAFVRDRCRITPQATVAKDVLWAAWREWCGDEGAHPGTKAVFVRDLRAAYSSVKPSRPRIDGGRVQVLSGIKVIGQPTVEASVDGPDAADLPDLHAQSGLASAASNGGALPEELEWR